MKRTSAVRSATALTLTLLFALGVAGCVSPNQRSAARQGEQWVLVPASQAPTLAASPSAWQSVVSPIGDAPSERDLMNTNWRWERSPDANAATELTVVGQGGSMPAEP
jgi:hypothetical protein